MSLEVPYFDLKRQSSSLAPEIEEALRRVISEAAFSSGPFVAAFEQEFARHIGCRHVVCVNSGTSALHLALLAMQLPEGAEVITTPMSFVATCWGISYCGLKPVFVDIDPRTGLIDLERVAAAVTPRTRVLLPVHLYGNAVDPRRLREVADAHGLRVLEDAAQAHGTLHGGRHVGHSFASGAFSFYPGKSLGGYGEGGALVTDDDSTAAAARRLRDHGSSVRYHHEELGFNYRMDGIQAAVLSVKLRRLEEWILRRREIARQYDEAFRDLSLRLPVQADGARHSYHLYVIGTPARDALAEHLQQRGVGTARHYPVPLHLQKAYAFLGHKPGDFPHAERHAAECLSLPMFPEMTQQEISSVIGAVRSFHEQR